MRKLLWLLLYWLPFYTFSQSFRTPRAAIYPGLGVFSKNFRDVFSMADNPAGLGGSPGFTAGLYAERRFMLEGLNQYSAVLHYGLEYAGIALQAQSGGGNGYQESLAGLSYGRSLGNLDIGIQFNYHRIGISGYGSAGTYSADIAVIWELTEKFRAGIQAVNPAPVFFGPEKNERYASVYKLGLGYEVSLKCFLAAEISKETGKTPNVHFALQYHLAEKFFLRAGVNTDAGEPFAGIGWLFRDLRLDVTGSYHPDLGFTPGLMLIFIHKKNK